MTASLRVDFLRPTPIDAPVVLRSTVKSIDGRKVVVVTALSSNGETCAKGEVVAVRMPGSTIRESATA